MNLKDSDYDFIVKYHQYFLCGYENVCIELIKNLTKEEVYLCYAYYIKNDNVPPMYELDCFFMDVIHDDPYYNSISNNRRSDIFQKIENKIKQHESKHETTSRLT